MIIYPIIIIFIIILFNPTKQYKYRIVKYENGSLNTIYKVEQLYKAVLCFEYWSTMSFEDVGIDGTVYNPEVQFKSQEEAENYIKSLIHKKYEVVREL